MKRGVVKEVEKAQAKNRTAGEVLGLRALVANMNNLINKEEREEEMYYKTSAACLKDSQLVFLDRESAIQMVFSNEDFFDAVYKTYYQYYVVVSNVGIGNVRRSKRSERFPRPK